MAGKLIIKDSGFFHMRRSKFLDIFESIFFWIFQNKLGISKICFDIPGIQNNVINIFDIIIDYIP